MADLRQIQDDALLAISTGDFIGAADLYARIEQLSPHDGTWPCRAGECLRRAGRTSEAVAALTRAVHLYARQKYPGKAAAVCQQILEIDPRNAEVPGLLEWLDDVPAPAAQPSGVERPIRAGRGPGTPPPGTFPFSALTPAPSATADPPDPRFEPPPTQAGGRPGATPPPATFPLSALTSLAEDPGSAADATAYRSDDGTVDRPREPRTSSRARPRVVLPATPFFSALTQQQLRLVNTRGRLMQLSPGEVVYAAGEASAALFVLAGGQIAVLQPHEVARLERGEVFGEEAVVLPGHARMSTLRATAPCQVLVLDRNLVSELVAATPAVGEILTKGFCQRLVAMLARTSPMLASVPEPDRVPVLGCFRYAEVGKGVGIYEPGDAPSLFVLLAGAAVATFNDKVTERLQPGDVFGEIALVRDIVVKVSVTAREKCLILQLPQADFAALAPAWPGVAQYLKALADKRIARLEQAILDDAPASQSVPLPPRILIIHGEDETRRDYQSAMTEAGFVVDATDDAATVDRLVVSRKYDVVLFHLDPAGQTGTGLLRDIRKCDLDVPIVLTTRDGAFDRTSATANYSVVRGFTEPIDVDDLVRAANRAVHFHRLTRLRREAMTRLNSSGEWMGDRTGLEFHFERALGCLHMAFQPIVSAVDNIVFAFEALLRSAEELLHNPVAVLRAAERLNRVHEVGRIARDTIADAMAAVADPPILFVNVHSQDLLDPHLLDPSSRISAFAPRIVLEITERTPLDELHDLSSRIRDLRELGYRFALDNLGAGHAGVGSLAQLEPEVCKLDASLIRTIDRDPVKLDLVRGMLTVCRDMNILTICEGVETRAERDALLQLGADLMQGFLFAKPGPAFPAVDFAALTAPPR